MVLLSFVDSLRTFI